MHTLYENLVIVIDAMNSDLEDGTMTQEQYDAKKKSTIKKMKVFVKVKKLTQDQDNELNAKFK